MFASLGDGLEGDDLSLGLGLDLEGDGLGLGYLALVVLTTRLVSILAKARKQTGTHVCELTRGSMG